MECVCVRRTDIAKLISCDRGMHMHTHISVNYREFVNAAAEDTVDSLFQQWCEGMKTGDMADNLAGICVARRYRLKMMMSQPPTPAAWDASGPRPTAFKLTVFNANAPAQKWTFVYMVQFNLGIGHFEPVVPEGGSPMDPGGFVPLMSTKPALKATTPQSNCHITHQQ